MKVRELIEKLSKLEQDKIISFGVFEKDGQETCLRVWDVEKIRGFTSKELGTENYEYIIM